MSKGEILLQFGFYIVPAIAVFASVYYFTNKWAEVQAEKRNFERAKKPESIVENNEFKKHFFPMQVDSYQRMVLFLERIAPNNMIMRLNNPGLPARAFQQKLLDTVRQEFEHNLAQQIFISPDAWQMVRNSKEEVVKIINMSATKLEPTALANDLSQGVFEITSQMEFQPTEKAILYLKTELNRLI